MNIDELAGRELDTLVAERLFGLEVEARINTRTGEKDEVEVDRPRERTTGYVRVTGAR